MIGLCLAALAGTVTARLDLPADGAFRLVWTHSIEKVEWVEDWRATRAGLIGVEARIKGSGAGMEPAPFARLQDGWYRWPMSDMVHPDVILARSDAVADHRLCVDGRCRPLSALIGGDGPVTLTACE